MNLQGTMLHKPFPFTATAIFKPKVCIVERTVVLTDCLNTCWYPVEESCHCFNALKPHKMKAEEVNLPH